MIQAEHKQYLKKGGIILLIAAVIYFLFFRSSTETLQLKPPTVVAALPKQVNMADYVVQTGNTVAFNSVDLVARIEGYLQQISFTDGSFVDKDKLLFLIEPEPYKEKLKEAEASVKAAQAGLDYAHAEHNRQKRMFRENATSQNNVQIWLSREEQAEAELAKSKANLINAQINYSYTHVKAPFFGRIGRHLVDLGNLVGNGAATKLATIEQLKPIYVYFNMNELDLIKMRAAAKTSGLKRQDIKNIPVYIGLQNQKNYPYKGELNFINTGLNASTGTMQFRAIFDNDDLTFVPGLFVKVRIPISVEKPRLTVPASAVLYDQIGAYLYLVGKDNLVIQQRVEIGPKDQDIQAISKGLKATDKVIISGLQFATPGKAVTVKSSTQKSSTNQKSGSNKDSHSNKKLHSNKKKQSATATHATKATQS